MDEDLNNDSDRDKSDGFDLEGGKLLKIDPVVREDIEEIRDSVEILATAVRQQEFWMGHLPYESTMAGYKQVDPVIVPAVLDDFTRRSEAFVAFQDHQISLEQRKLDLEKNEQRARQEGDASDIRYRWISGGVLWVVAGVAALGFLRGVWLFAAHPSFSGALGLAIVGTVLIILGIIIGGKGRLTQIESDMQVGSLKSIPDLVKSLNPGKPNGDDTGQTH